jgi:two-component system, OmpR family, heavy metal sensor histidine kinase CusS
MIISFRTRLFVISGVIVTAVITAVMLIGWNRVLAFETDRLEQRLCMEAKRLATQPMRADDLQRIVNDILGKLHLSSAQQVMLYMQSSYADEGFQTANWRPEFAQDSAPWRNVSDVGSGAETLAKNAPDNRPPPRQPAAFQEQQGKPPQQRPPPPRGDQAIGAGTCALASLTAQDRPWRAARFTHDQGSSVLAVDLFATQTEIQSALKQALKLVVPLALIFTALGAWLLASLTMRPVNRLRGAMQVVTQKALNKRLSSYGEDYEFSVLIDAYNTMLSRLEISFQQASRFSADAAHELKTPLTILQGRIEQSMRQTYDPATQHDLTDLLDEVGRLSDITRKLLLLSQVDAGYLALQHTGIHLSEMLGDMASDMQMLLTDQRLQCAISQDLMIEGDALMLRQLFNNLISNAVRYCRTDGWIRLSARALPAGVEVVFSNATQVISPQDRARFFDRFYRGDAAHNRRTDGNGLGLSLAREIARAHGGDLVLLPSAPDEVVLQLTLPLS